MNESGPARTYSLVSAEELFRSLCATRDIFNKIGVPYILSGGTLLGGFRQGSLIKGDTDWDLEILDDSLPVIFKNRQLFLESGIQLDYPVPVEKATWDGTKLAGEIFDRRVVKACNTSGGLFGDIFLMTLFSDGIVRRVDSEQRVSMNAKMSFPMWFFENRSVVKINGEPFDGPGEPEMMVERIYGPNWRTPIARGTAPKGYNEAGASADALIEPAVLFALERGWVPRYPDSPRWPMQLTHVNSLRSAKWMERHEHPEIVVPGGQGANYSIDEANARQVLTYRAAIHEQKRKIAKLQSKIAKLEAGRTADAARFARKLEAARPINRLKRLLGLASDK